MTDPEHQPGGTRDCGPFFLDAFGPFQRDQLDVTWTEETRLSNEAVDSHIEQAWAEALEEARNSPRPITNGRLCRLVSFDCHGDRLALRLGPVSFREFVGTNATAAYIRHLHGQEVLADPLGVSAALVSRDGYLLLGRRSDAVAFYPRRLHPVSGVVELKEDQTGPNPFDAIIEEVYEETGLPPDCIRQLVGLGLVRDKRIVQPELIFEMQVDQAADRIRQNYTRANDAQEHMELVMVRDDPSMIVTFAEQNYDELTPVCLAALLLHGMSRWGTGWFTDARGYLHSLT